MSAVSSIVMREAFGSYFSVGRIYPSLDESVSDVHQVTEVLGPFKENYSSSTFASSQLQQAREYALNLNLKAATRLYEESDRILNTWRSKITTAKHRFGWLSEESVTNVDAFMERHDKYKIHFDAISEDMTTEHIPVNMLPETLQMPTPLLVDKYSVVYEVQYCWPEKYGVTVNPRKVLSFDIYDQRGTIYGSEDDDRNLFDFSVHYTIEGIFDDRTSGIEIDKNGEIASGSHNVEYFLKEEDAVRRGNAIRQQIITLLNIQMTNPTDPFVVV